ncbi:hypothetical protein SS1G_11786 [Sclerotinia sclerotiorum 1980 UF-70]|uniref:Alcohol dehydrogenase-like C-terminal domain-containing protein n=2 Tax=Sclerotinia sclerotiorum (strain ATCC 18683 / 1980 / Ss-1) TaxID=665079 RepID=A7F3E0_SCLS1|nr:hypothetical protein SS1G_11786 [Sclerotinia sclerotiorum 1980 UF-70]APA14381.1 hypothetical protein sscle_12g091510 [Sclerotinia sclerotiorum 1980 UF-70]EDN97261.1 hypothetical protein SS1G_11786 [Sclerotinia sclerotiorum 1980 UF-70]
MVAVLSDFQPEESVAVLGAGRVGLMAVYSGELRGARNLFVLDSVKERLQAAERIGCVAVDFTECDAVEN